MIDNWLQQWIQGFIYYFAKPIVVEYIINIVITYIGTELLLTIDDTRQQTCTGVNYIVILFFIIRLLKKIVRLIEKLCTYVCCHEVNHIMYNCVQ